MLYEEDMPDKVESSILDEVVEFRDDSIAPQGLHPGVISDVVALQKAADVTKKPQRWLGIKVTLADQTDIHGEPITVMVEMTMSPAHGSNLRNTLVQLGFTPTKDGQFKYRNLLGTEVDVFVRHESGSNKNYKFARVEPRDLNLRGKGIVRQVATEIDIVVESEWGRRQRERKQDREQREQERKQQQQRGRR